MDQFQILYEAFKRIFPRSPVAYAHRDFDRMLAKQNRRRKHYEDRKMRDGWSEEQLEASQQKYAAKVEQQQVEFEASLPEIDREYRDEIAFLMEKYDIAWEYWNEDDPHAIPIRYTNVVATTITDDRDGREQQDDTWEYGTIICTLTPGGYAMPRLYFQSELDTWDGAKILREAVHPHIGHGSPCLGAFHGGLTEYANEGSLVTFIGRIRSFLHTHNPSSDYWSPGSWRAYELPITLADGTEVTVTLSHRAQKLQHSLRIMPGHTNDAVYFAFAKYWTGLSDDRCLFLVKEMNTVFRTTMVVGSLAEEEAHTLNEDIATYTGDIRWMLDGYAPGARWRISVPAPPRDIRIPLRRFWDDLLDIQRHFQGNNTARLFDTLCPKEEFWAYLKTTQLLSSDGEAIDRHTLTSFCDIPNYREQFQAVVAKYEEPYTAGLLWSYNEYYNILNEEMEKFSGKITDLTGATVQTELFVEPL